MEATSRGTGTEVSKKWLVLLEVAKNGVSGTMGGHDVARLLAAMDGGPYAGALHSPERYALQLMTTAASPAEALHGVVSTWVRLVRELALPEWDVARTEVITPEELERDLQNPDHNRMFVLGSSTYPPSRDDLGHELLRQAFSDPLTGSLGRESFEHQLHDAFAKAGAEGITAIVCLGLYEFRTDDRFSGAKGDEVLREAAARVAGRLRPGDSLARFNGDSFAILLERTSESTALAVAHRVLDALRHDVITEGDDVHLSVRAGVAVSQPGEHDLGLIGKAETALALAKASGDDLHVLLQSPSCEPAPPPTGTPAQALQDGLAHLQLLQEVAMAANEADTLQEAAGTLLRYMRAHIGCALGHLWVSPDTPSDGLRSSVWYVGDGQDYKAFQQASDELIFVQGVGLPGRVLVSGAPIAIADLAADPEWLRRESSLAAGLASGFAFPVLVGREVVAVLECFTRAPMDPSGSFLDVLSAVGSQLGRVVERERAATAMQRSQDRVQRSEAGMRQVQALVGLGSWQFDLRTGESSWTDAMYDHYGLDPSGPALNLETAMARVYPADRASVEAAIARATSGERCAVELRILRPDGQLRWLRAEAMGVSDDKGVVVAIHGTSQDITERKLMEDALRARETQLAEAARVARLGWWELDLTTDRLLWSPEMYLLCEREPRGEVTAQRFFDMVHPDDRQRLLDNMARIREPGGAFHVESPWVDYRAFTDSGRERWFRARIELLHDEQGSPVKLSGTMQDVTEERLSEESLRSTRELYQRILETAHEGILTLDAQDIVTFANARLAQTLGFIVDELLGMPASVFMDETMQAALFGHDQRRGAGLSEQHEARLRAKDGTFVQVLISASSLVDEEGNFGGTLAMVTDVSALRQAEDAVRTQSLPRP